MTWTPAGRARRTGFASPAPFRGAGFFLRVAPTIPRQHDSQIPP